MKNPIEFVVNILTCLFLFTVGILVIPPVPIFSSKESTIMALFGALILAAGGYLLSLTLEKVVKDREDE